MDTQTKRNKRIFISDIHMNDPRSLEVLPNYNYSYYWISPERTELLARFLETEILGSDDVAELVILGDLYDQWVCPTRPAPEQTFQAAMDAPRNQGVKEQLVRIAASDSINLYYVPGNHDILMEQSFMRDHFPGIQLWDDPTPLVGTYLKDGVGGEHCSQYNFFCAPNPGHPENHWLPTGYFLSRFGAESKALKGDSPNFLSVLGDFVKNKFKKDDPGFVADMLLSLAESMGLDENADISMGGLDGFGDRIALSDVIALYRDAMVRWDAVKPNGLTAVDAIETEILGYSGMVYTRYYLENKARFVIFGHTHKALLEGYDVDEDGVPRISENNDCAFVYANSGTWIDGHPCSFIETEIKGDRHYISWYEYTADGQRQKQKERHITLNP